VRGPYRLIRDGPRLFQARQLAEKNFSRDMKKAFVEPKFTQNGFMAWSGVGIDCGTPAYNYFLLNILGFQKNWHSGPGQRQIIDSTSAKHL